MPSKHLGSNWIAHAALALCIAAGPVSGAAPADSVVVPLGPLPAIVEPTSYRIELKILPDAKRFSGRTEISVVLKKPTATVWLHGQGIEVSAVQAVDAQGRKWPGRYREADPSGVAEVRFDEPLPAGEATLVFEHDAAFHLGGFGGRLSVMKVDGVPYVSSAMFSHSARSVFPSFDEPRFKTPYEITLIVPSGHTAMTNAPEVSSAPAGRNLQRVSFARSKPLPTYLVGFTVGPYDVPGVTLASSALRQNTVPVRAFGSKGKAAGLRYALDSTPGLVDVLESYFGIAYPYEKLDLIAIPDPHERGGMENAAAISYGEHDLVSEAHSSVLHNRYLLRLHAHELAHQWFGDLVTPSWWDDFWINESFASWFEQRAVAQFAPGRDFERQGMRWGIESMVPDSLTDAREIRPRIRTVADMSDGLNQLMYGKGNAVLAMIEHFVGEEAFRTGVRTYLGRFPHGSANSDDFLAAFDEGVVLATRAAESPLTSDAEAGQPSDAEYRGEIDSTLRTFLDQPGVPRLDVQWTCGNGALDLEVKQSRYLPLGSRLSEDRRWHLPFCVAFEQNGSRLERLPAHRWAAEQCEVARGAVPADRDAQCTRRRLLPVHPAGGETPRAD